MESIKDVAIVLRAIPYGERDQIITALTRDHGRITVLAKNSIHSRRFGAALEPFSAADWIWSLAKNTVDLGASGTRLAHLKEAHIRRDFSGLRSEWEILSYASATAEVLLRIPEHDPAQTDAHARLFALHAQTLAGIENAKGRPDAPFFAKTLFTAFLIKLLQWYGTPPQLQHCRSCDTPWEAVQTVAVDSAEGGWRCTACAQTSEKSMTQQDIYVLQLFTRHPIADLANHLDQEKFPLISNAAFEAVYSWLTYHVPGFDRLPLKSLNF